MKLNKKIRLAGIDLDGTLLNDEKQLCEGAAETLSAAAKNGIHIIPITGRPFLGIPDCVKEVEGIDYVIASNGAQIIDLKTGKSLYSFALSNEKSRELIKILRSLDCMFEPFANGAGYTEAHIFRYYEEHYKDSVLWDYIASTRKITGSIEALFENASLEADEFFIICKTPEVLEELLEKTKELDGIQHCTLGDRFIEITKKGTDKGEALAVICRHLGIAPEETIAFGDGENDLLMLQKAGVAVAMENAFPSVKEKADIIAKSNNNNGVCEILKLI